MLYAVNNLAKEIMTNKDVDLSVYLLNKEEAKETKRAQNALTRARAKKASVEAQLVEAQLREISVMNETGSSVTIVDNIKEDKQDD